MITYDSVVSVKNCSFINLSTHAGGAIYIFGNWEVWVSNSIFIGNNANQGGAIFIKNTNLVVLTDNRFEGNHATTTNGTATADKLHRYGYRGGAITIH